MRSDISLCRVFAMLLIILCHLTGWLGIPALSQLFNVGTFVFLIISGYLYADKQIDQPIKWLFGRWKKLCIPLLIWFLVVILLDVVAFKAYPGIVESVLFILNLQGIGWVITSIPTIGKMGGGTGEYRSSVVCHCYFPLLSGS